MNAQVIFAFHQVCPISYLAEGKTALCCHLGTDVNTQLTLYYEMYGN